MDRDFDDLVAEGDAVPVDGWDFSWFEGRATEERPPWGYASLLPARLGAADAALDIQTGGGEVFGEALTSTSPLPALLSATEEWPPNLAIARQRLASFGVTVTEVAATDPLPFGDDSFDLVLARHPNVTPWAEIARVLRGGGTFLSQQVSGLQTNRELYEFMLGPQHDSPPPGTAHLPGVVAAAGLELLDLRYAESRIEFFDVGAVVYFLRKVLWTVPGFTVQGYLERLRAVDRVIRSTGSFVSYSRHALVEARKL
ncbi:MAG: methyltransferase protein [Microbacteriaceae bacterium]|nr:methyltransferase protein [Microbacteriaceae bacterium]